MSLGLAIQCSGVLPTRLATLQRRLKSLFHELLAYPLDRRASHLQTIGDRVIAPAWSAGPHVGLQENPRVHQLPRCRLASRKHHLQHLPFLVRQRHDVLLRHGRPPCQGYAYPIGKKTHDNPSDHE